MKFSFYSLADQYQISVPLIQRDFAQGRQTADEVRSGFLSKLKKVLTAPAEDHKNNRIHLDFVYGYVDGGTTFVPLDGQQRLTTLFLLHWYIACKEDMIQNPETQRRLNAFTYQTRESSRKFCKKLVAYAPAIEEETLLSAKIRDTSWFHLSWNNDPTVDAMLNMLDSIHKHFFTTAQIWPKLSTEQRINFDFIDIKSEDFKLTDELYIKMNSRGKPLTKFENFKAQFTDLLNNKEFEEEKLILDGAKVSLKDYFAFRIDGEWTNLFWDYRKKIGTDVAMVNFLTSISELLYYIDNDKENSYTFDLTTLALIYGKKSNVLFLIDAFDVLCKFRPVPDYFNELLYCQNPLQTDKMRLFGEKSTDLFYSSISGETFNIKSRILFYAVLSFGKRCGTEAPERFRHFLRIVRNMTNRSRQPANNRTEYAPNLRLGSFGDYSKFINAFADQIAAQPGINVHQIFLAGNWTGFPKENFEDEKTKTRLIIESTSKKEQIFLLEDSEQIQGITDNFDLSAPDIKPLVSAFYEIWNPEVKNSLVVRALLAVSGDYAIKTHKNGIYYFGDKNAWNKLFTNYDDDRDLFGPALNQFLKAYTAIPDGTPEAKLKAIKNSHISKTRDWIYYFIKYPAMVANYNDYYNLFLWDDRDTFNLKRLGSASSNPLSAFHMNPYVLTVYKKLKDFEVHFALRMGRYTDYIACLEIIGIGNLYCEAEGWELTQVQPGTIPETLYNHYKLTSSEHGLTFTDTDEFDRIEIAVNFCRDLVSLKDN
ncbi:DUF262 domain-containing protein [Mucilaginibacter lutimaris]|uniref:DUF262 domain-containing protein n=1 Tax=Mucilaginibacter lutimaris TaxID=931629 RepID=A0ABW2ZE65_9SPHI